MVTPLIENFSGRPAPVFVEFHYLFLGSSSERTSSGAIASVHATSHTAEYRNCALIRDQVLKLNWSADCEAHFADGLRRLREGARALIDFQQHPSIVDCRDFFRTNARRGTLGGPTS